jgi:hypothetical protein
MILPEQKVLFLHIPKTAGQSVTRFLFEGINRPFRLKDNYYSLVNNTKFKLDGPEHYHHCTLDEYVKLGLVNNLDQFFKFTIFRNPYTRFVSAFYFNQERYKYKTYKEFIVFFENHTHNLRSDLFRHFVTQTWYIDYNLKNLDKIFYFEKLNDFISFFQNKFKFKNQLSYDNVNNFSHKKLDNYTISFINEYYKRDFELLGYKYETP